MADPAWLSVAKTIPAGRHTKIECCANDRSLMISNEARGFRAYCFRCGPAGFVAHGDFSIDQLKRRREELAWQQDKTVRLPRDFTTDIPPSEAIWLYKAGVSAAVAKHYGFGYSPFMRRVILPVYNKGILQGYTARSTINERPKYIENVLPEAVFASDPTIALPRSECGPDDALPDVCITEDVLSAVRVGRCVRYAVSLLGTSFHPNQLARIPNLSGIVGVWMDSDIAGRKASAKIQRTLLLQGYKVRIINSPKDPKYYSNRDIRRFLIGD